MSYTQPNPTSAGGNFVRAPPQNRREPLRPRNYLGEGMDAAPTDNFKGRRLASRETHASYGHEKRRKGGGRGGQSASGAYAARNEGFSNR